MVGEKVIYIGSIYALKGETGSVVEQKIQREMFGLKMEYNKLKVRWDNPDLGCSGYLPEYEFNRVTR